MGSCRIRADHRQSPSSCRPHSRRHVKVIPLQEEHSGNLSEERTSCTEPTDVDHAQSTLMTIWSSAAGLKSPTHLIVVVHDVLLDL